jgi:ABC-type transport system involved in cytochrome c biogenesis permease subunit
VAGAIFEVNNRRGAAAGLAALLTAVVLGVSMMSAFDPAIGPLVPVLASYWLNIHVTVITSSYGFLGLGSLLGGLILVLHLFKGVPSATIRTDVLKLDRLLFHVITAGLALLSVGTLLGGVWANESWGRYWGWDPKETWSLVTILVYALVTHFRWIPALNRPWVLAAGSFLGIASVIMTYFGVNYFLAGLHSYAQGEAAKVPTWVYVTAAVMVSLVVVSGWFDRHRTWASSPAAVSESSRL